MDTLVKQMCVFLYIEWSTCGKLGGATSSWVHPWGGTCTGGKCQQSEGTKWRKGKSELCNLIPTPSTSISFWNRPQCILNYLTCLCFNSLETLLWETFQHQNFLKVGLYTYSAVIVLDHARNLVSYPNQCLCSIHCHSTTKPGFGCPTFHMH